MGKPLDAMEWVEQMERRDADFKRRVEEELATMRLEQQLVRLREARGMSQTQLARALGVTQQAIAKAESGQAKNVELRTLLKHVLALGGRLEVQITTSTGTGTLTLGPTRRHPKSPRAARTVPRASGSPRRRAASR